MSGARATILARPEMASRPKLAKSQVEYGPGKPNAHCGICRHFIAGAGAAGTCQIVAGLIHPRDWCNRFERKEQ